MKRAAHYKNIVQKLAQLELLSIQNIRQIVKAIHINVKIQRQNYHRLATLILLNFSKFVQNGLFQITQIFIKDPSDIYFDVATWGSFLH